MASGSQALKNTKTPPITGLPAKLKTSSKRSHIVLFRGHHEHNQKSACFELSPCRPQEHKQETRQMQDINLDTPLSHRLINPSLGVSKCFMPTRHKQRRRSEHNTKQATSNKSQQCSHNLHLVEQTLLTAKPGVKTKTIWLHRLHGRPPEQKRQKTAQMMNPIALFLCHRSNSQEESAARRTPPRNRLPVNTLLTSSDGN